VHPGAGRPHARNVNHLQICFLRGLCRRAEGRRFEASDPAQVRVDASVQAKNPASAVATRVNADDLAIGKDWAARVTATGQPRCGGDGPGYEGIGTNFSNIVGSRALYERRGQSEANESQALSDLRRAVC